MRFRAAMIDLDASSYQLDALHALTSDHLEKLCFVDPPARHGYAALEALHPKHGRFVKYDPLNLELKTGAAVRRWRTISSSGNFHIIYNPPAPVTQGPPVGHTGGSAVRQSRARRRRR
jgi:hypothetical protein